MTLALVATSRAASAQHWLLDSLPVSRRFEVEPADVEDMASLMEETSRHIPGLSGNPEDVLRVQRFSNSIFAVRTQRRLVGSVAFLFLNETGFEALREGGFPIASPDTRLLARATEKAAALYAWAMCLPGFAIGAMGNIMERLRRPAHRHADIYARPGTLKGEQFMVKTGFFPLAEDFAPPTLWVYCRPRKFEQAAE